MASPHPARALQRGGVIAIAAPAGPLDADVMERGAGWLRDFGFDIRYRDDVTARSGFLAGDDDRRVAEWMQWIADPATGAIVCARGGYGCHRIMDRLDATAVAAAAIPIIGYSDLTTMLLWQWRRCGLMGFHGPMLERGQALTEASREALVRALLGESLPELKGQGVGGGRVDGRLTGGSLSLVVASLGTPWEIDTDGAILMLEDVAEQPYRIDRMLQQLRQSGKLEGLIGVGVGQMVDCEGTRYPVPTVHEVIRETFETSGIPIVVDLPFGHCDHHLPWPVGGRAVIDGDRGTVEVIESAAA